MSVDETISADEEKPSVVRKTRPDVANENKTEVGDTPRRRELFPTQGLAKVLLEENGVLETPRRRTKLWGRQQ